MGRTQVQEVALEVSKETGHDVPENERAAELLDNVMDCVVVHACTGLDDTPLAFLDDETGLPDTEKGSLFRDMNENETAERTWNYRYWRGRDSKLYKEYASLSYGYFFAVLSDQLRAAAKGDSRAPKLTITVMSDSNISPLLALYNLSELAQQRPPYLSALIHEVYEDDTSGALSVRVLFNGEVVDVCGEPDSFPLCPLEQWESLIEQLIPDQQSCPILYSDYEFLAGLPDSSLTTLFEGEMTDIQSQSGTSTILEQGAVASLFVAAIAIPLIVFRAFRKASLKVFEATAHNEGGGIAPAEGESAPATDKGGQIVGEDAQSHEVERAPLTGVRG